jgi:hypothetical protein
MRTDRRSLLAGALALSTLGGSALAQEETPVPPWLILAGQGSGPLGRWGHTLAIDTWFNRLLVAGGRDVDGTVRGDLWSFDIASYTWMELDLSGPRARSGSASALPFDGSGFYYFGGESDEEVFDDLWWFGFAGTAWQNIEPVGARPAARSGTKGTIDGQGRFVISHGRNGDELFDDTWAFDPATRNWTDISPPAGQRPMARADHSFVALPDYGVMLLFGGCSDPIGPCPQGDLWSLDIFGGFWTDISPFEGPSARTGAAMSRQGNTVLLVGGDAEIGLKADVWTGDFFDGFFSWSEYTQVNHGPLGIYRRAYHDMTAANGAYYVFGGLGVEGALSDLWTFSPERIQHPGEDSDYIEPE